jgi:hypothetical protein
MNKNMTVIEWLMQTLEQNNMIDLDWGESDIYYTIIDQAKVMHKQEIIASYNTGYLDSECNHINDADQHYHQLTQKG